MNKIVAHGSYILIKPISSIGGICKGKIYSKIYKHQLEFEQIVYYLEKDITKITFEGNILDVILHYHIFSKEVEIEEKKEEESNPLFKFNCLKM